MPIADAHNAYFAARLFLSLELGRRPLVYLIKRHTSRRGKSAEIDFLLLKVAPDCLNIESVYASRSVAQVLELPRSKSGAVICRESPSIVIARLGQELFGDPNAIRFEML